MTLKRRTRNVPLVVGSAGNSIPKQFGRRHRRVGGLWVATDSVEASWSPEGDTDVILWMEARNDGPLDSVGGSPVVADGANVGEWRDLSSYGNNLVQTTDANRPQFRPDAFGAGVPGVECSNARTSRFVNVADTLVATGITTIFAFNQSTPNGAAYHTDFDGGAGTRLVVMARYYSGGAPAPVGYLGGGADDNSGVDAISGTQVETFVGGGGSGEQWRNGISINTGTYTDSRVVGGHLPSSVGGGELTYGAILVFKRALDETDRLAAEAYVSALVGL